jgi:hypothetical protein
MTRNGKPHTDTNPCLAAALAYATYKQRPLFVFPAEPGKKKSRVAKQYTADGQNWGLTNNPKTIEQYWRKWPDSNVCIVTGDINGIFVVETDTAAHGKDGEAELKKLIAANGGEWPATLTAKSPSGSKHYFFTWPEDDIDIRNSDSKLAPGIDVRGTGGMVVAVPSYVPKYDARYEWISPEGQGIVNAPAWLKKLLAEKPVERKPGEPQALIDKLSAAMELIPNDKAVMKWEVEDHKTGEINTREGWEDWNNIGMALHRATGGSDAGFAVFDKWCRKNKHKYNEKYTHYSWYRRWVKSPPKHLGAGTLFLLADQEQPGWRAAWDHEHPDHPDGSAAVDGQFTINNNGIPHSSQGNIRLAMEKLGVKVRHNLFEDRSIIEGLPEFELLNDPAMNRLWLTIDKKYRFRPAKEFFWTVVFDEAYRNSFHPVREYLDGLKWDGKKRIDKWLIDYAEAEDSKYVRAVGALFLVAAVRRIQSPGCKFDEMPVFQSEQGLDKSTGLSILAVKPEWFSDDLPLNADSKKTIERLRGRWIIEAAELKGMRYGDVEHLKAFLSRTVDRARMSYDRARSSCATTPAIGGSGQYAMSNLIWTN